MNLLIPDEILLASRRIPVHYDVADFEQGPKTLKRKN